MTTTSHTSNRRRDAAELYNLIDSRDPVKVRGEWNHYRCIMCDDHGAHLGISLLSGRVHCLRCGYATVLARYARGPVNSSPARLDPCTITIVDTPEDNTDLAVLDYMVKRGAPWPQLGWGYGRGSLRGMPVIPVYGALGSIVYYQVRNMRPIGPRYLSPRQQRPRLDFKPVLDHDADLGKLVLVEGPMDMLRLRHIAPKRLWVCATFGSSITKPLMEDVSQAAAHLGLDKVFVWFDSEYTARSKGAQAALLLTHMIGINAKNIVWPAQAYAATTKTDQNSADKDTLLAIIKKEITHDHK